MATKKKTETKYLTFPFWLINHYSDGEKFYTFNTEKEMLGFLQEEMFDPDDFDTYDGTYRSDEMTILKVNRDGSTEMFTDPVFDVTITRQVESFTLKKD